MLINKLKKEEKNEISLWVHYFGDPSLDCSVVNSDKVTFITKRLTSKLYSLRINFNDYEQLTE